MLKKNCAYFLVIFSLNIQCNKKESISSNQHWMFFISQRLCKKIIKSPTFLLYTSSFHAFSKALKSISDVMHIRETSQ